MDETDFWSALEYRACRELAGVEQCAKLGLWCDGFIPDRFDIEALPPRISGRAWIGLGRDQEQWSFELMLPTPVLRRDEIRWPDLLPADGVTRWLTVDFKRKHLVIALGEAARRQ